MSDDTDKTILGLIKTLETSRAETVRRRARQIRKELEAVRERLARLDDELPGNGEVMTLGEFAELCEVFRQLSTVLDGHTKMAGEAVDTLRCVVLGSEGVMEGEDLLEVLSPADERRSDGEKDDSLSSGDE